MPGIDGRETYSRLREIRPDVKVLLVTGYADSNDIESTLQAGALGLLGKPFRMHQLVSAIESALDSPAT